MYSNLKIENTTQHKTGRIRLLASLFLICGLLLFLWFISIQEVNSLEQLIQLGQTLKKEKLTLLKLIGGYILGGLLFVPITLLVAATIVVFGPLSGFFYALLGAMLSSLITFGIGLLFKKRIRYNLKIKTFKQLNLILAQKGILSMILARNFLILPFTLLNIIAGTSQISFRDYLIGTTLGLIPYFLALTIFTDRLVEVIIKPSWQNILLALVLTIIFLFAVKQLKNRIKDKKRSAYN